MRCWYFTANFWPVHFTPSDFFCQHVSLCARPPPPPHPSQPTTTTPPSPVPPSVSLFVDKNTAPDESLYQHRNSLSGSIFIGWAPGLILAPGGAVSFVFSHQCVWLCANGKGNRRGEVRVGMRVGLCVIVPSHASHDRLLTSTWSDLK